VKRSALIIGLAAAIWSGGTLAQSRIGDVAVGARLAETWCASCHLISAEQASATTEAPPFATIADRQPGAYGWIEAFLADPHPPMPDLSLTRAEIRDLTAYIASLAKQQ